MNFPIEFPIWADASKKNNAQLKFNSQASRLMTATNHHCCVLYAPGVVRNLIHFGALKNHIAQCTRTACIFVLVTYVFSCYGFVFMRLAF